MSDEEYTSEYGEIEAFKHTKYWFKKDIKTIKKSAKNTLKFSPIILIFSIVLSSLLIRFYTPQFDLRLTLTYSIVLFPIFLLGYLMLHVMVTKGYDVDPYAGTHIKSPKFADRFSVKKILASDMPRGRKIMTLVRLALYLLLVFGLLANIFLNF